MILTFIFLALAAACNAVMDTSVQHYNTSIFPKFNNQKWWDGSTSWLNKYVDRDPNKGIRMWFWIIPYPVQLTDAFHFFKTLMIIFVCLSIMSYDNTIIQKYLNDVWYSCVIVIILLGSVWNLTFSLFYNHFLSK